MSKIKGFSLIEMVMVLAIVGLMTTIASLSISILNNDFDADSALDQYFSSISERSVLSGNLIGWFASERDVALFYLNKSGEKFKFVDLDTSKKTWSHYSKFRKSVEMTNGDVIFLEHSLSDIPLIVFYPSGFNSGAHLIFKDDSKELRYRLDQQGSTLLVHEK